MSVKKKIREYLLENVTFGDPVDDDESLINSGIMDSTGAMDMIMFIEDTFEIEVDDDEIDPDNFDTINLTTAFVEKKKG